LKPDFQIQQTCTGYAAEEEKLMQEAIASDPMGGLPSMEELENAVITVD
jgi:hypothetical protein